MIAKMNGLEKIRDRTALCILFGLALVSSSCSYQGVRVRVGAVPSLYPIAILPNASNLGRHNFLENNGLVYTCRGGLVDIVHVRNAADFTKAFAETIFDRLMAGDESFSLRMREPSKYLVELEYPGYWQSLSLAEKERIASDLSVSLGAYICHVGATWHEILTWFGYKSTGIIPEFYSAFTVEDVFSNLLGSYLAEKVLNDNEHDFDKLLTEAIREELEKLGVQPRYAARQAAKQTRGKRNFDIGLGDGYVTPWLMSISGIPGCNGVRAESYPVPDTDILCEYGFSMVLEIEPRELEKGRLLKVAGKRRTINPETDFPVIMKYVLKQAVSRYGYDVST